MNVLTKTGAPRYKRDNITSYLLVSALTCDAENLAITLVEIEPGGVQHVHNHEPEQMYHILEGSGVMTVNGERRQVQAGDCIYFPSLAKHGAEIPQLGEHRRDHAALPQRRLAFIHGSDLPRVVAAAQHRRRDGVIRPFTPFVIK